MKNIMKGIYITIGFICFALCAVGVVLPILPSTPFLIVSAFCFAKGSEKANKWFLSTNLYKKHLDCFVKERSMPLKAKINILAFASLMLVGAFFAIDNIYGKLFIVFLIIAKYYYFIFRIKTKKHKTIYRVYIIEREMSKPMNKAIPVLPCSNADTLIEFYKGLGFQLVGKFVRSYLILEYNEIELHFYGTKQVPPDGNSSMCIIRTDDVDTLHNAFETGLKTSFGSAPRNGFPKITKVRDLSDDRRFTLTDPSGNTFYILTPKQAGSNAFFRDLSDEQHAKQYAILYDLVYSKEDYTVANNMLPKLLSIKEHLNALDRAKLLLTATEIYVGLGLQCNETELKQLIAINSGDGSWRNIENKYNEIISTKSGEL